METYTVRRKVGNTTVLHCFSQVAKKFPRLGGIYDIWLNLALLTQKKYPDMQN